MSVNARSILIAVANLFALFVVIGFCAQGGMKAKTATEVVTTTLSEEPAVEALPVISQQRQARAKGYKSAKGKSAESDCIPLYPTAAPTKGKGRRRLSHKGSTDAPVSLKASEQASQRWLCFNVTSVPHCYSHISYLRWLRYYYLIPNIDHLGVSRK